MFLQYNGHLTPTEYLREKLRTVEPGGIHHEYLTDEIAWRERQADGDTITTETTHMTHTPGPWTALKPQKYSTRGQTILVLTDDCYPTAFVPAWTDTADEARANARLIAAAPDMLAALQTVTEALNGRVHSQPALSALSACRDAITKATETTP